MKQKGTPVVHVMSFTIISTPRDSSYDNIFIIFYSTTNVISKVQINTSKILIHTHTKYNCLSQIKNLNFLNLNNILLWCVDVILFIISTSDIRLCFCFYFFCSSYFLIHFHYYASKLHTCIHTPRYWCMLLNKCLYFKQIPKVKWKFVF